MNILIYIKKHRTAHVSMEGSEKVKAKILNFTIKIQIRVTI